MDNGDRGPHDDGRATPAGRPPDDWDAEFTAIVSGVSGDISWAATPAELDDNATHAEADLAAADRPDIPRAPESIWDDYPPDSPDARRARRELRRAQRAESLAAFQAQQAAREAEYAADTEHFVPPEPPPIPRPTRRTVAALILMVAGIALIISPALLPTSLELAAVVGLLLLLGGAGMLLARLKSHHRSGESGFGADDGAEL